MSSFNKSVFKQLISDNSFVDWASGSSDENSDKWLNWKNENPGNENEFDEAYKIASLLKFKPPEVSGKELSYQWNKTKDQINKTHNIVGDSKSIFYWYSRIASVLLVPLLIAALWYAYRSNNNQLTAEVVNKQVSKMITLKVPMGSRMNFILPDSSEVWMNSGSELIYPLGFTGDAREVELIGEAVFKVKKSKVPFIVHNNGPDVKVYGTIFNVNSYPDNESVTVALLEGKVSLNLNSKEVFLKPGEVSKFNMKQEKLNVRKSTRISKYTAWRDGRYIFINETLKEITKTLQHNYNVTFVFKNPKIANYRYNAKFENESLEQILYMLSLSASIKYKYTKPILKENGDYTKAKVILF